MSFWRKISPWRAIKDFKQEFLRPTPYRWPIIGVSAAATFAIFSVMWQEGEKGPPFRPQVTYITSWSADRTDAEIIASNIENQKRNDAAAAEEAARQERIREMYKTLGRMSGMDVDKIEADAKAEQAREGNPAAAKNLAETQAGNIAPE